MGYETKLLIGTVNPDRKYGEPAWFQILATLDLSKTGYDSAVYHRKPFHDQKPLVYWYHSGSEEQITADCYDGKPVPLPVREVVELIEDDLKHKRGNYRYPWALALLRAMQDDPENLQVLFYGH